LVRPCQIFSGVTKALDSERVAAPTLRVEREAQSDYRSVKFVEQTPSRRICSCFAVSAHSIENLASSYDRVAGPASSFAPSGAFGALCVDPGSIGRARH
jgi:hypothetical protein